jgi:predicted nuclease of predicted toxin-antitoxin system
MQLDTEIWVDAQLSTYIAKFIQKEFNVKAKSKWTLGLKQASDLELFMLGKQHGVIILTKDADFVELLSQYKAPPKIVSFTCGNTSNKTLSEILSREFTSILDVLKNENLKKVTD